MGNPSQICYFPYLFLGNVRVVEFDGLTVWNFSTEKSSQVKDKKLRGYLTKLLSTNRLDGKPIKDIGIIGFKKKDSYKQLTRFEQKRVDDLRKILFLCSVAKSNIYQGPNAGHRMATSENFTVVYQNFRIGSPNTAYSSGRIVSTLSGGHKIDEIKYEVPRYVLRNGFSCDEKVLQAMEDLKHSNIVMYRRILRATDAMMNGYSNSDDVSYESRILEQSRSFEILFDLPQRNQRKEFKSKIANYCQEATERKRRYKSERGYGRKEWETGTRQVMWADRFYTLRNHIIHGEAVRDRDFFFFGQRHFQLGLWFFLVSVKHMSNAALGKELFYDAIQCKSGKFKYDRQPLRRIIDKAFEQISFK